MVWGSGDGHINDVTLRRALLVVRWTTLISVICNQPVFYGQLSLVTLMRQGFTFEYWPMCGDALRLGSKGGHGSLQCG